ncbi:MAG: RDD family protein [Prochlorotrichaceae cyanobacterium]
MRFSKPIRLQTPESVELEFWLAGIGSRALALMVDYTVWGLLLSLLIWLWSFLAEQTIDLLSQWLQSTDTLEMWLVAIFLLVTFVIYVGYFVIFETLWQGQTPGKRFAKIRVIGDDGRPARLGQAVLRALLRPFDDLFFVGFVLIALTPQEKRLGDWLAGTLVVKTEQSPREKSLQVSSTAREIADRLVNTARLEALLPDDFAVVREYLQRRTLLEAQAKRQLSLKLAKEIQGIIDLETLPYDMSTDHFLEAVYLAYQRSEEQNG